MVATIIDGAKIAEEVRAEVAGGVEEMKRKHGVTPGLAVVLVGDNPASVTYVRNKGKACEELGMYSETFHLPADSTQEQVLEVVKKLNKDKRFHGILTQLPFPKQVNETAVTRTIDPAKDVDGLHPYNVGLLAMGEAVFVPCTPAGVQQLLLRTGNDPAGKHMVICGRSNIVGRPLSILMAQKRKGANATVTVCHTGTRDMTYFTRQADILVAAIGGPRVIKADMVRKGAVVIDVGINRVEDATRKSGFRLVGDVDYDSVSQVASFITPVPGGVGPMTIAMLMVNTLTAAKVAAGVRAEAAA